MDVRTDINDCRVLSTSPVNFAGAARAHFSFVRAIANTGCKTAFIARGEPTYFASLRRVGTDLGVARAHSDAYPLSDANSAVSVAEELFRKGVKAAGDGEHLVLCATYLIPFFQSVLLAAEMLRRESIRTQCIAIPAGSDIWQLGKQVPTATRSFLTPPSCDRIVTYSHRFAAEVEALGAGTPIDVIPPVISTHAFSPPRSHRKLTIRKELGISESAFVILNCSNMRPVKRIDVVCQLAAHVSRRIKREVVLLLVGPETDHLKQALSPLQSRSRGLTVRLLGLWEKTVKVHQAADLAVNASVHESFGISVAESCSVGLPVVTTSVTGLNELLPDHVPNLHYPEDALAELARGRLRAPSMMSLEQCQEFVIRVAGDCEYGTSLGIENRDAIRSGCSLREVSSRWAGVIQGTRI